MFQSSPTDTAFLTSLVNHIVLPPRLPGKRDEKIHIIEDALTVRLRDAGRVLRDRSTDPELIHWWDCLSNILQTGRVLNAGGKLDKNRLTAEFERLERKDFIILHVTEQNAGLLIRRHRDDQETKGDLVTFEAFEASSLSQKALETTSALQWDFPGVAAALPYADFQKPSFREALARFLQQASVESIKNFTARTSKAGSFAFESRETVHPSLITEMLITVIEANGRRTSPTLLRKQVRDDVSWTNGAEIPWRRSPYWLVLRVGIQRYIYFLHGAEVGRVHYKFLLCVMLANLLIDALEKLGPESIALLKAKLGRRLAKLEGDKVRSSSKVRFTSESLFALTGRFFRRVLENADEYIRKQWEHLKPKIQRPISSLPCRANRKALRLTLSNSGSYLDNVLSQYQVIKRERPRPVGPHRIPPDFDKDGAPHFRAFVNRYCQLSTLEREAEMMFSESPSITGDEKLCRHLAKMINHYLDSVGDAYVDNPEQNSIMILTVMRLWVLVDRNITIAINLLTDYSPAIPAESLDVLQLATATQMIHLNQIQIYLKQRKINCTHPPKTIFEDPMKGCFADRYFNESTDAANLQALYEKIESSAEKARTEKEKEWQELTREFDELERTIAGSSCIYTMDDYAGMVHNRNCTKCYLRRRAGRMRINVMEHPLPSNMVHAKAVLFELQCPRAFKSYRDVTWRILGDLANPKRLPSKEPRLLLSDYSEIKPFGNVAAGGVSLASTTKSFLATHYKGIRLPVDLDRVCLPSGLRLGYFDSQSGIWTGRQTQKLTFVHHCHLKVPSISPFSQLNTAIRSAAGANGLTSYEVIASQNQCPSGLNVHEFMAYQTLFSGKSRRWITMLVELGSSNLNFSTEGTASLVSYLAIEAGPAHEVDHLRSVHSIFRDPSFCKALIEQIEKRMNSISSNWRETNCMSMLLTLILRLHSIGPKHIRRMAIALVEKVRQVTLEWIRKLRTEIHQCTDADTSRMCSKYAFMIALICRKTFTLYATDTDPGEILDLTALSCFIECSVTLQDNMVNNPSILPSNLRNALVSDVKLAHQIRFRLRYSFERSPCSLQFAINSLWPQQAGCELIFGTESESFLIEDDWWFVSTFSVSSQSRQQTLHYHLLEGHLLIDGTPLGKLPARHRESVVLEQLFGKQSLLTYPSGLAGMSYMLAFCMNGHQVHLGFRGNSLIVRACVDDEILELVPIEVFGHYPNSDLPASLRDDCVHWLHLSTGIVEIRRKPDIWKSKGSSWRLDVHARTAVRRRSTLVDPRSPLFQRIARVFDWFEDRDKLTVFQPQNWRLSVELRRLELTFFVNDNNLLFCKQLRSEIDPDQDAGTWYGLRSKLVLRDLINISQRTVIVPMGPISYKRNESHVWVKLDNNGDYGRFVINKTLGRLDCPPEPRLLYLKAQLHAYTSFVVPDPLTGLTGTEEALRCLKSGLCQPWTPINAGPLQILQSIARLTPKREYYPKDMRCMQMACYDPHLTDYIQDDEFRSVVQAIIEKSRVLSLFSAERSITDLPSGDDRPSDLERRSIWRRRLYERCSHAGLEREDIISEVHYCSRDRITTRQARTNVFTATTLIHDWPQEMATSRELAETLQKWPSIGGYDRSFDKVLLSDCLNVSIPDEWGALVTLCRGSEQKDIYNLMFVFASMSFHDDVDMNIVRTLIAFAVMNDLKMLEPPQWPSYMHFRSNHFPNVEYLNQLMKPCRVPYPDDERSILGSHTHPKLRRKLEAAERDHEKKVETDCTILAEHLLKQWPCVEPQIDGLDTILLVDIPRALEIIRSEWLRLYQNMELSVYIQRAQHILDSHQTVTRIEISHFGSVEETYTSRRHGNEVPSLCGDLIVKAGPKQSVQRLFITNTSGGDDHGTVSSSPKQQGKSRITPREIGELERIIQEIAISTSAVERKYAYDLIQSVDTLKMMKRAAHQDSKFLQFENTPADVLLDNLTQLREMIHENFGHISHALKENDSRYEWLMMGGLWPCITPVTLLESLQSQLKTTFGPGMKESIVQYGEAITKLQRFLRIEDAVLREDNNRALTEMRHEGHENWKSIDHPGWLLLEIESNILIRKDQVDVALATMSPSSGSNSVLQMNMGQGKTSCIMPMVAAELADTKKLVRVVVPKALLLQTAQLLQIRLGGLLNREIRHVPFSRKTPTDEDMIRTYARIHREIMESSGIIVALPEHNLSFMLSGIQRLSDSRILQADLMIKVQALMRRVCRDILDECDYTLSTRTQLIYPSGTQSTVDGHPHRWETAEAVLGLVAGHLWNLQRDFRRSIEIVERPQGGFPLVFFLRKDVEEALINRLVQDVIQGQLPTLATTEHSRSDRSAIKHFISEAVVRPGTAEKIRKMFPDNETAQQTLYLLRGFFVHRLLLLTLKKRWNVQYGLHPQRDPIAVPYHAKGVPSDQAEWGHPDVAILFTCLSFYFGGLDLTQLQQSLGHILKSDDPSSGYDRWTQSSNTLPDSLREWNVLNIDDDIQLTEIWKHLRYNIVVIDYFLNHFVFPRHAKQFQIKLQASGWDIPLFSPRSQVAPLTTGFSGTNDNRTMLPLTIEQQDLPTLSHTNAEVLTYLLQDRNRKYVVAADTYGKHISEIELLKLLKRLNIRMLIDAGAQILEMDNASLAKAWLQIDHEAPAAVYFNAENKPFVIYNHGGQIPLVASSYADNLGDCLIYLDEAHTRGTDLKLPANAKGALTLGLGQTKDHTVQAAMRLRQLGSSQSITFLAPPEVHQSILDHRKKQDINVVDSHDVISWLLKQTCNGIEQMQPLYYAHGMDFCRRTQAELDYPNVLTNSGHRDAYLRTLQQQEKQTLEQLYTAKARRPKGSENVGKSAPQISAFQKQLNTRRKEFQDVGNAVHSSALQEVEQEREVAFEVESVREVQKPIHFSPLCFPFLHKDILRFVETGRLASDSEAYEHAFAALRRTGIGQKHGINSKAMESKLFVTREFMRTVKLAVGQTNDNFLRPVNWILWSTVTQSALIVIPEEAEILLPIIREATEPITYLLTYAAPITRAMVHFSDLRYYSIPSLPDGWTAPLWLKTELGILAARVYFEFGEYMDICQLLGISSEPQSSQPPESLLLSSEQDGVALTEAEEDQSQPVEAGLSFERFTAQPLVFLQEWIAIRRKGQDFTHTPIGYVCQGKALAADHPFFLKDKSNGATEPDTDMQLNFRNKFNATSETHSGYSSNEEDLDRNEADMGVEEQNESDEGDEQSEFGVDLE